MQKKLTIRLDEQIIERAKTYARDNDCSLSELVENFFHLLDVSGEGEPDLSPGVKKMVGILKDSGLDEEDYKKYLIEKYL